MYLKSRILATHICPRVKIVSWPETSRFCIFRKTAGFWAADGRSRKAHRHNQDCFLGSPGGGTSLGQHPGPTRQSHSQPPDGCMNLCFFPPVRPGDPGQPCAI